MTTWFTADQHFGHVNIIEYTSRPFTDTNAMNEAMIERWNDSIRTDDTVWVLGDVALGRIAHSLPIVRRLNGRKLLLAGNHDRCWAGHGPSAEAWIERYLEAGFAEIHQGVLHIPIGRHRVLACHFPYHGDSQEVDRFVDRRPVDRGEWLLHGHVHERWRQSGRMINVGVDGWALRPVSDAEIVTLIEEGPAEREVLPYGTTMVP